MNITTATDLFLTEDESLLASITYAILGCLISGLFLVVLGLCLRKNSQSDENE